LPFTPFRGDGFPKKRVAWQPLTSLILDPRRPLATLVTVTNGLS
jgi:hypothetical protein